MSLVIGTHYHILPGPSLRRAHSHLSLTDDQLPQKLPSGVFLLFSSATGWKLPALMSFTFHPSDSQKWCLVTRHNQKKRSGERQEKDGKEEKKLKDWKEIQTPLLGATSLWLLAGSYQRPQGREEYPILPHLIPPEVHYPLRLQRPAFSLSRQSLVLPPLPATGPTWGSSPFISCP